jgi:hypothetical protein
MAYISRITSLSNFNGVLLGRDIGKALKEGHVYGLLNISGVIVLEDLGEHADARMIQDGGTINHIATEGVYCLTKLEYLKQLISESRDEGDHFDSSYHREMIKKLKKELKLK